MKSNIKLALFDMDNVLCDYNVKIRAAQIAEISGKKSSEILTAIWESGFETMGDDGTYNSNDYLVEFGNRIGYNLSLNQWIEARKVSMLPNFAVLDLVKKIKNNVNVAIFTNNTELVLQNFKALMPEAYEIFYPNIYASAMFKKSKPNPESFAMCLEQLKYAPNDVLFIDDLIENVEGAKTIGIHAHQYTSVADLQKTLEVYNLI